MLSTLLLNRAKTTSKLYCALLVTLSLYNQVKKYMFMATAVRYPAKHGPPDRRGFFVEPSNFNSTSLIGHSNVIKNFLHKHSCLSETIYVDSSLDIFSLRAHTQEKLLNLQQSYPVCAATVWGNPPNPHF